MNLDVDGGSTKTSLLLDNNSRYFYWWYSWNEISWSKVIQGMLVIWYSCLTQFIEAVPGHAKDLFNKLRLGLGCNSMNGSEKKHQQIDKHSKNISRTLYQVCIKNDGSLFSSWIYLTNLSTRE